LNEALNLAEGEYIKFFATDDIMLPRLIEKSVKYLEQNIDYAMVTAKHITYSDTIKVNPKMKQRAGSIYYDLLFRNFSISAPSTVLRRSVFEDVGYFDENLFYEDWDMWLRISKNHKIGFIDDFLVLYRFDNANSLSSNFSKMEKGQSEIIDKQKIQKNENEKAKRKLYLDYCSRYFKKREFKKYRYYYTKLLFHKEMWNFKLIIKYLISIFNINYQNKKNI